MDGFKGTEDVVIMRFEPKYHEKQKFSCSNARRDRKPHWPESITAMADKRGVIGVHGGGDQDNEGIEQ